MTDPDLLAKKLAFVESCVADLQRLAVAENIDSDIKERRFVEHMLQLATFPASQPRRAGGERRRARHIGASSRHALDRPAAPP